NNRVVVVGGATDAYRLGLMARSFEEIGVRVIVAPANIQTEHFGRMIGADQIVGIRNTGVEPSSINRPPLSPSGLIPGGVSQNMSHARIDKGRWPVLTHFGLLYGWKDTATPGETNE